jgi:Transcription elongation factor
LQAELGSLSATGHQTQRVAELEAILSSAEIVESSHDASGTVAFGATVTVEKGRGTIETYTVVGVDELSLYADAVSWISPFGRRLLAAKLGDRVTLDDGTIVTITKVEYRAD